MKKVLNAVDEGDVEAAERAMPVAFQRIDKAAKGRVIHPNAAARKKSRLARAVNRKKQS